MPEKRQFPRVETLLSILLKGDQFSLVSETKNISASGAYCKVSKPIPELTKLAVTLLVPVQKGGVLKDQDVYCEGVVVRSEKVIQDNQPDQFFVAIFFSNMSNENREILKAYVAHQMDKTPL